jgi:WD40 repeat protein
MGSMRWRSASREAGRERHPGQRVSSGRGTGWAALLGVLAVVLAAAATIAGSWASLRWLWVVLIAVGAVVGAPAALLASPWWQHRQTTRRAREELAAARARERACDQRDHFDPRGRGVLPFAGRRGWYFTGRIQALRELADWLAAPLGTQPAVRVVTGAPGSGKSAVLGRLVLLAEPDRRQAALEADPDLDRATLPPEGSIELSVHAHGRTAQQLGEAVAARFGVEAADVEDLLNALQARTRPAVVVVDAVDEASGPDELADVLNRLAQTGGVRLLVGVRHHLVDRLVDPDAALDLDDPAYLGTDDVTRYVRRCLLLDGDPEAPTPYRGRPGLAGEVSRAVAARAGGSFLVAQLVSLALVNADRVVDVAEPGWQERFPREVGQAMRAYLDGFGPDRRRVRDLLVPLAFAEGDGLTDEAMWAALASELGTGTYQPQDVRWLLHDTSAPNLLQSTSPHGGMVAWRLFHQALAEYLRDHELRIAAADGQRRVTEVLTRRVPHHEGRPDWLSADVYTRCHLPAHAAAGGLLDELVVSPGALLVAEPTRLLPLLPIVTTPAARAAARAYQQAVHQLGDDRPLGQRASCLQRAARYCGATDLAERILRLGIALPWTTPWAYWRASGISRQLTGHTAAVEAVALGQVDGQPIVVSGSHDRTIRVWDARSGQPRGEPLTGHTAPVVALALGEIDGVPVIVSGSDDRIIRVWDARSGQPRGEPLAGHTKTRPGWPTGIRVALGQIDAEPIIVSGGDDGTVWVWDARSGRPRGKPLNGHTGPVLALELGQIDGEPVIISSSMDSTVRVWDARSGRLRRDPLAGHSKPVLAVTLGQIDGQPMLVSASDDDTVKVWDARSGQLREVLGGHAEGIWALALGQVDGEPVIVAGGDDGTVRVWDARSGQPRGDPLAGHTSEVGGVAIGEIDGEPVIVSGGHDDTVRIWNARFGHRQGEGLTGHAGGVWALAAGEIDGEPVVVSGGEDRTVRVWDARSGRPRGEPLTGHTAAVCAVVLGTVDEEEVIVSGGDDTVRVWDARSGRPRGEPLSTGGFVRSVAVAQIAGEPIIVSSGNDGMVRVWDARSGRPRGEPLVVQTGWVPTGVRVALLHVDGDPVVVSAGGDGMVRTWDVRSGQSRAAASIGLSRAIWAVAVSEIARQPVIVLGSDDKTVRVWNPQLREQCRIEVDAEPRAVVCLPEGFIVVATGLGLVAFQLTIPAGVAGSAKRSRTRP